MTENKDEVPVKIIDTSTNQDNTSDLVKDESENHEKDRVKELERLLEKEKENLTLCEERLKRVLADYQNLEKKTKLEIEKGVITRLDKVMVEFLQIYDDFIRAKTALANEKINVEGLEGILRNMDSLLTEYSIVPIEALGEIFDPNLHEAISIIEDATLDEYTITKEIRKGYISKNRVIRPAIVEISKKPKSDKIDGEENG